MSSLAMREARIFRVPPVEDDGIDLKRQKKPRVVIQINGAEASAVPMAVSEPAAAPAPSETEIRAEIARLNEMLHAMHRTRHGVLVRDVIDAVANYYDFPPLEIISHRRTKPIVKPRHVAMFLSKKLTMLSLPEIGRRFGGRDHTTVLHAVNKIDHLRTIDAELSAELDEITAIIRSVA